ncbi:YafY family transcriptional regulator [Deinococcus sp. Arct2-2]|uniref:helix-turn-helix transcriptional regulator n=1 Tax=Deinococcus sp. Arct2-2 TaxID=2568653 RepID=UPI0010A558E8|nr:YafY family protein [Deinococcus sp. Arct2-2]THF66696.1 YafY family transcriptional regulator [Deinococcus sp. Arct2-2]
MNRTDRLLAIVLELQGRGRVRAEDLARQLDVSKRTIYRDVLALNEAGVPIISAPGQGYTLMPGYFLPPLHFSVEEAVMLLLGSDVVAQAFDSGSALSAARKLNAVFGEDVRGEVQFLYENLRLVQRAPQDLHGKVRTLRQTIAERRTAEFTYHKPQAEQETRQVDPHGLFRLNQVWLLAAFDHARAEFRTFRLDRIEDLKVLPEQFRRQPHFKLERDETRERRELTVQALFDPEVAREVKNNLSYYVTQTQDTSDGLLVTLQVRTAEETLP